MLKYIFPIMIMQIPTKNSDFGNQNEWNGKCHKKINKYKYKYKYII